MPTVTNLETELLNLEDDILFFDVDDDEEDEEDRGDLPLEEEEEDLEEDEELEDDDNNDDEETDDEPENDKGDEEDPKEEQSESDRKIDELLKRFDQEKNRSSWLEDQLEKLIDQGKSTQQPEVEEEEPEPFDYDAAEDKYGEALLAGETAKASKIRNLINQSRQEDVEFLIKKATSTVADSASSKSSEAIEEGRFVDLVELMESKHPSLDIDSPEHDEEATAMVNTLLAGFVSQGKTKTQALKMAVSKVIKETTKEEPTKSLGGKKDRASRKNKADAANNQPPKSKGSSTKNRDIESLDVSKMSERDYDKLTAKERKILRGD